MTYRQAGELLAELHEQEFRIDPDHEARADAKALAWLDRTHRIDADTERRLRRAITRHGHEPTVLVPTHGDYHPRNWLVHRRTVAIIDLGRAAWRPAHTDLSRLAAREFLGRPELETAFLEGYGRDPREPAAWRRTAVREAIGTAVWAFQVETRRSRRKGTGWSPPRSGPSTPADRAARPSHPTRRRRR